jgi:hypothetical protein
VDNRRLAEGSLSRRSLRVYRVAFRCPETGAEKRTRRQVKKTGDRSRIEGGRQAAAESVILPAISSGERRWREA